LGSRTRLEPLSFRQRQPPYRAFRSAFSRIDSDQFDIRQVADQLEVHIGQATAWQDSPQEAA